MEKFQSETKSFQINWCSNNFLLIKMKLNIMMMMLMSMLYTFILSICLPHAYTTHINLIMKLLILKAIQLSIRTCYGIHRESEWWKHHRQIVIFEKRTNANRNNYHIWRHLIKLYSCCWWNVVDCIICSEVQRILGETINKKPASLN